MILRKSFLFLFISCSCFVLISFPANAATEDPPSSNADAIVGNNLLLDRALIQGQKSFTPQSLWIFDKDIRPILALAEQLPAFGVALEKALHKNWHFGFDKIHDCPTGNSYYVNKFDKVACQTGDSGDKRGEVIINPDWYESIDESQIHSKNDKTQILKQKQRDLFVHELLLGITLGTGISAEASSKVFDALTRQPLPSAEELQLILESSGFGVYSLLADVVCPEDQSIGNHETDKNLKHIADVVAFATSGNVPAEATLKVPAGFKVDSYSVNFDGSIYLKNPRIFFNGSYQLISEASNYGLCALLGKKEVNSVITSPGVSQAELNLDAKGNFAGFDTKNTFYHFITDINCK